MFQRSSAIRLELHSETVFVAQPADVEIIFQSLVVFQSDSLCDFHWEVVMDVKCPYSVFARFPVMFARTERGMTLVFAVDGPRPACRSFKKLISLRFQLFPVLLDLRWVFRFLRRPYLDCFKVCRPPEVYSTGCRSDG